MVRIDLKRFHGGNKMKNLTLNKRNIFIVLSYLFIATVVFTAGYFWGINKINKQIFNETVTQANSTDFNTISTPLPSQTTYRVVLEDGQIRLYIDENGISRLVSSEEISEDAYPISDIASLKNGFIFDAMDKAISLMENFIS